MAVVPPTPGPVAELPQIDKVGHASGYFVFGLLLALTILRQRVSAAQSTLLVTGLIAVAYGALLEGLQGVLPDREMDLFDLGADAAGAFGGAALALWLSRASNMPASGKVY